MITTGYYIANIFAAIIISLNKITITGAYNDYKL
jgi:hypothetical protein